MWRLRALRGVCHPHAVFALNLPQLSTRFVWGNRECLIGLAGWRRHPMLVSAISRRDLFFRPRSVASILSCAMPFYHRVYTPGELQFITTSTYRRTPLFVSDRFRHCFVQRLDEVRQELHFLLIGWVLMPEHFHVLIKPEPAETTPLIMKGLKEESAKRILRTLRENLQYP